jgi:hypothetical protein
MTTNVEARTVQLSARTDSPDSSSATAKLAMAALASNENGKVSSARYSAEHLDTASILALAVYTTYMLRQA